MQARQFYANLPSVFLNFLYPAYVRLTLLQLIQGDQRILRQVIQQRSWTIEGHTQKPPRSLRHLPFIKLLLALLA